MVRWHKEKVFILKAREIKGDCNLPLQGPWLSRFHHLWTRITNSFEILNYSFVDSDQITPAETLSDLLVFTSKPSLLFPWDDRDFGLATGIALRNNLSLMRDEPCEVNVWVVQFGASKKEEDGDDSISIKHHMITYDPKLRAPSLGKANSNRFSYFFGGALSSSFDLWAYLRYRTLQVTVLQGEGDHD